VSRPVTVAAAQLGPIAPDEPRSSAVERMIAMLHESHRRGAELVVFPELALTTFFPRYVLEGDTLDACYEREMPGTESKPLFDEAARLGVGFCLGFAELVDGGNGTHRYNASVLVERDGRVVATYRKVHLPGHGEPEPHRPFQHLERGYFEPGPDGFGTWRAFGGVVGMAICNDRRWPETYRVLALQGAELVLIGYNTPTHYPPDPGQDHLASFHHRLVLQAGAYQNGLWAVAVAKCGVEDGVELLGDSMIVAPSGEVVAQATTLDDEVVTAVCDLDRCADYRRTLFDFERYRMPEHYGLVVERRGEIPPPPEPSAPKEES